MLIVKDGAVLTPTRQFDNGAVAIDDGKITYVGPSENLSITARDTVVSAAGAYIAPGFIDIHVNGGGGADAWHCMDDDEALRTICQIHAKYGTTSLVPTLITAPVDHLLKAIEVISEAKGKDLGGAEILGTLVEGPFISRHEKGAHNPDYIRIPAESDWGGFLDLAEHILMMTIAPEEDGGCELGAALARRGVVPAVGHSHAELSVVEKAVDHGFRHVTHLYCSTPGYTRDIARASKVTGLMEASLILDELTVEIIGDGKHVPAGLLTLAVKAKGVDRLCTVTDAINATGLGPGTYRLGDMDIVVEDNVAKLADRTFFAGSVATMDECVRNMMVLGDLSVRDAVRTATAIPARIIGVDDRKGRLAPGMDADLVVFDDNINVKATIVGGNVCHMNDSILQGDQRGHAV